MITHIDEGRSAIETLRKDARKLFMIEFSEASPEFELTEPPKTVVPHCWRWEDFHRSIDSCHRPISRACWTRCE